jgi:hypothetical protein
MAKSNNWTREETIVAFNVYCKVPFKSSSKTNPTIIKYANIIGRSPSALNMKVGNFGRLDPELKKQGAAGADGPEDRHGYRFRKSAMRPRAAGACRAGSVSPGSPLPPD